LVLLVSLAFLSNPMLTSQSQVNHCPDDINRHCQPSTRKMRVQRNTAQGKGIVVSARQMRTSFFRAATRPRHGAGGRGKFTTAIRV
jgi:hypothetical protein